MGKWIQLIYLDMTSLPMASQSQ